MIIYLKISTLYINKLIIILTRNVKTDLVKGIYFIVKTIFTRIITEDERLF